MRLACLTLFVLIAFAGNSVLARLALSSGDVGPWGFSLLRFVSGACVLLLLATPKRGWSAGRWPAAATLLIYGVFFSYAYLLLATGTGALMLFASVQITMLIMAYHRGERMRVLQWSGLILALGGLIGLLSPGLNAPSPIGAGLMIASGVGWGLYSILGKGAGDPIARTAGNFARAAVLLLLVTPVIFFVLPETLPEPQGIVLAIASGTITSGLGYALWYYVLRDLSVTTASVSQLSVPVIAALGGALFVFEPVTLPFAIICIVVLVGVALATVEVSGTLRVVPDDEGHR